MKAVFESKKRKKNRIYFVFVGLGVLNDYVLKFKLFIFETLLKVFLDKSNLCGQIRYTFFTTK